MVKQHGFTPAIAGILKDLFGGKADQILEASQLLQYLNIKTKSANRGSKSRGSFANHYAIYVLVEDYLQGGFNKGGDYSKYEGAKFSDLFRRQRALPFGSKLQNHALNHRMNEEFKKFFPACEFVPILRDAKTNRYWLNENLLKVSIGNTVNNIAPAIIKIIDAYVEAKRDAFESFLTACQGMQQMQKEKPAKVKVFIADLLKPNVDARVFEIVSFSILKQFYGGQSVFWGWAVDKLSEECLILYKTGRTNANDGGIDFVMRPLGRFFQVTETTDVKKYFLDIDKVQRYPITFVVKSASSAADLRKSIEKQAGRVYPVRKIVERYMECVEEIINIPTLMEYFESVVNAGHLSEVINEIVLQSKVEFNHQDLSAAKTG